LETTAAANGFVIAAPNGANVSGSGYAWNVPGFPSSSGRDDVGFLSTVMDVVTAAQCTDPGRIYAAGYSGGGRMVSALACQLAGKLAAIAPVAGVRAGTPLAPDPSQPDPATCQPSRPVPVIAFHGQQDNTNPYNGGGSDVWQYSVPAAMTRWAQIDGCATTPQTSQVTTHVSELTYAGCSAGTQLELYAVSNGGHTWPGTSQPSPGNGITTEEISADNLMWAFFSQFGTNTPPPTNDTGPIVGLANKCVDVRGADTTDGTPVQLYTCNGTDAQQWTVGTDGTLRALGKCLAVTGGGTTNGTPVQLWDCNGNSHQQWTYSGGRLINPNSAKCLDVTGQNPADSTPLQIWDCNGQTNQNWTLPTT
jgi:poly(3-hydroxybutyrate) depolymerase